MLVRDFDYSLPPELIAQQPAPEREQARLLVLPRAEGPTQHATVAELPERLVERLPHGALLVVNDSRVIPARLRGRKASGGAVELLLVAPRRSAGSGDEWVEEWTCLGGASKPIRPGAEVELEGGPGAATARPLPSARVLAVQAQQVVVEFRGRGPGGMVEVAERIGELPLPPYIARPAGPHPADRARYQTVYARDPGSAAAPTAGLHLGERLLSALEARGIERTAVTLHVGLGTFAPLALPDEAELTAIGELHPERYAISPQAAQAIATARAAGRAIVAVGTTTVRTLESAALGSGDGSVPAGAAETRLFIGPGHRFQVVDALLTNFHLPRSTLLMLVAGFAGRERVLAAYRQAIERRYRFFSYGDAMLIV